MSKDRDIAVDLDGTIHSYTSGFQANKFDPPVEGAIQALYDLSTKFKTVWIFTARDILAPVERWIKKEFEAAGLPYPDNIKCTNRKPKADIYIDDKALKFEGKWSETMKQVDEYKTWVNEHRLQTFKESWNQQRLMGK